MQAASAATLTAPIRQSNGSLSIGINGGSGEQVTLQGSGDLNGWNDVQSYQLSGAAVQFHSASPAKFQFFRLKSVASTPGGGVSSLPALSDSANSVFVAGEGFDTVQFAPNGMLGFIFWKGRELMIRERTSAGGWFEQTVAGGGNLFQMNITRMDYKFQPAALLLYDSNSQPHVFKVNGGKTIAHFVRNGTAWSQVETIQNNAANADVSMLVGAIGNGNVFHLGVVSGGATPNLTYGSNRGGSWNWNTVSSIAAFPTHYLAPSYAPRWLSLAVDSNNAAHLVFRPEYRVSFAGGYVRAYNELAYASNVSGQWNVQIIQKPRDDSGEAGHGLSIAIGPDNKPYIASWHNERGPGGSAENSRLFFQSQDSSGNWTRTEVISRPDGYIAGDGEKGTGFAPYLRFDAQGRPHILFLDHGSEHFGESGQSEYAGHIRHAYLASGQWKVESIYRQSTPMREQMLYPAFAMNGSELVVTGLARETQWNMSGYPPTVNSTYRYVVTSAPLR
ncbi:MAG TPA: hypothetical protein VF773_18760 [Verrucomicrobiae bacterium]